MDMSTACSAPVHGTINADDRIHPRFAEYGNYRSAMTRQLVACPSFSDWLAAQERYGRSDAANQHPRIAEYRTWLRENVNCVPAKVAYIEFWDWLEQNLA